MYAFYRTPNMTLHVFSLLLSLFGMNYQIIAVEKGNHLSPFGRGTLIHSTFREINKNGHRCILVYH